MNAQRTNSFQQTRIFCACSCQRSPHLWLTAGLSCDGDSVSVTAAEQPSIEDVVMGAIPGLPKVYLHNPVLAYEVGDDFMKHFIRPKKENSIHLYW